MFTPKQYFTPTLRALDQMILPPAAAASVATLALAATPVAIVSSRVIQHPLIHRLFHTNPFGGIALITLVGVAFLILSSSSSRAVGNNKTMQQQVSATISLGGSKQAPKGILAASPVPVAEVKELTIVEYIANFNPGMVDYMPESPSFAREELWLDFKEAAHGMEPQFRSDGTRVYHPALIGWCLDMEH